MTSKLRMPGIPPGAAARQRVMDLFDADLRLNLVVAPAGYGKTTAIRQWADAVDLPVAWVSLDQLDANPVTFWLHVLHAIRSVVPDVDEEPAAALLESPRSRHFLAVLLAQLERSDARSLVVLDDLGRLDDRDTIDDICLLVERVGDRLHLCTSSRSEPPFPTARWRTLGWVADIGEEDLRFRDEEACAAAALTVDPLLDAAEVSDLNRRVEGWPLAFQLALLSRGAATGEAVRLDGGGDRLLADFLVGEVLDRLTPEEREAALVLSVVEWFDSEIARELGGGETVRAIAGLRRRHLVQAVTSRAPGRLRFHPVLRNLLEDTVRWRDPAAYEALHRAAASLAQRRGNLAAAHRHLVVIGDDEAANGLVVDPVLELVDAGDLRGVRRMIGSLPATMAVADPRLALDLALAWHFAGSEHEAITWSERAEWLGAGDDPVTALRLHVVRCIVALEAGRLDDATTHVEAVAGVVRSGVGGGPIERRLPIVAARVALSRRDLEGAGRWLALSRTSEDRRGRVVSAVSSPALGAWADLLGGRLRDAEAVALAACDAAERMGIRPHHAALDALLIAAACRLGMGDLASADDLAGEARTDAGLLGWEWGRVRAAAVAADVRLLLDGPAATLAVVGDARSHLRSAPFVQTAELDRVAAKALLRAGRRDDAIALLATLDQTPPVLLVAAEAAVVVGSREPVVRLLAGSAGWPLPERLAAAVLRCAAGAEPNRQALADALAEGAATGWVSPFIGHGSRVDEMLLQHPLERLHPRLLEHLRRGRRSSTVPVIHVDDPMTPREHTILALLPSHLSYAQIGERLYLSVNTVKSNLKSIYRKLGVATRADAVESARANGLL